MYCLRCLKPLAPEGICYGMHDSCFSRWFKVSPLANFSDLTRIPSASHKDRNDLTPPNSRFFKGAFKKYSAILEGRSFILTMRQPIAPELPKVEYLCNQIATSFHIPVAKFYLIHFEDQLVFVTENFIHNTIPMDLQPLSRFNDSTHPHCEDLIAIIKQHSKKPYDVKIFIKTILFDALIGNHHRHASHFAFLVMPYKTNTYPKIELSPIYNNRSYLSLASGPMLKEAFDPKGRISTSEAQEPTLKDYVLAFKKLGLFEDVLQFYRSIHQGRIENLIQKSFCSTLMKEALKRLIATRYEELKNVIES